MGNDFNPMWSAYVVLESFFSTQTKMNFIYLLLLYFTTSPELHSCISKMIAKLFSVGQSSYILSEVLLSC